MADELAENLPEEKEERSHQPVTRDEDPKTIEADADTTNEETKHLKNTKNILAQKDPYVGVIAMYCRTWRSGPRQLCIMEK
jgi:hypothetical protein